MKNLQERIKINRRRLQVLMEQRARFGFSVPAHIILEIEDLEEEIKQLQAEMKDLAPIERTRPISNIFQKRSPYSFAKMLGEVYSIMAHLKKPAKERRKTHSRTTIKQKAGKKSIQVGKIKGNLTIGRD